MTDDRLLTEIRRLVDYYDGRDDYARIYAFNEICDLLKRRYPVAPSEPSDPFVNFHCQYHGSWATPLKQCPLCVGLESSENREGK